MCPSLSDASALVTGGSSGIGRAIAKRLAAEGAKITVADIRETPREGGEPTQEVIENAQFVECDVSDPAAIRSAIGGAVEAFGSLDVMVNNAGIYPGSQPIDTVDPDAYEQLMAVNCRGTYFGCVYAAQAMRENDGGGAIVNLSSIAGLVGFPDASTYCTAKGAIANLTRELAVELGGEGIRVNAINPGVIETAMTTEDANVVGSMTDQIPLERDGVPEDVASVAAFLASDEAAYVTGHNLVVDGGYLAT
jgi:NAD(P)-dependent dehydrogenase (short-subunit alcohol dehydrogenase family)